jgi:hypothetical protein
VRIESDWDTWQFNRHLELGSLANTEKGYNKGENAGVNMARSLLFKNARLIDSIADRPENRARWSH